MKHARRYHVALGLMLGVVVLVGINLLGNTLLTSARMDLTQQGLYTLSDGSRGLLASLDEPVTLRFYLSRETATRLPAVNTYANRVEELLKEFERESRGMVRLRVIDPEPFSEQEDRALAQGVEGIPVDTADSVLYFGAVASGPTGMEEVIPFFSAAREDFLEYDLARAIHRVARPATTVIGLLSTLPMSGVSEDAFMPGQLPRSWVIFDQIEELFEVRTLESGLRRIPDEVDVLMVVDPSTLAAEALYAIDQFVLDGGRALVFVDPHTEADPAEMQGGMASRDGYAFDELLESWGLRLRSAAVAADINLAQRVRAVSEGRNVVVDYPVWLTLRSSQYDTRDAITAELGDVVMASAGVLDILERDGVRVSPLIETTPGATVLDPVRIGPGSDPVDLVRGYQAGGESLILAARVGGILHTAYPGGAPGDPGPERDDDAQVQEHLEHSRTEAAVIVIADTDMLRDEFWVSAQRLLGSTLLIPTAANNTLVINALEHLAGDENLISIRSRGGHSRPFTLLEEVRREAEIRFLQKEQELLDELAAADGRLEEIREQQSRSEGMIVDQQQETELARFRDRKVQIRGELREVRRKLREDIERIQAGVRLVNIALMPVLVGIGGLLFGLSRGRRRSRRD